MRTRISTDIARGGHPILRWRMEEGGCQAVFEMLAGAETKAKAPVSV
jgi:hypothetical protein